ncbi:uncharacterized protein J3D65DRAFT_637778 [Phyllosticta citribraziliensis]|uniref:Uncharacterized protein n=1 Tax=Phyllosticta citribraziliensis TaxID=989973 RepID=A0ABR1L8C4_9PEZI
MLRSACLPQLDNPPSLLSSASTSPHGTTDLLCCSIRHLCDPTPPRRRRPDLVVALSARLLQPPALCPPSQPIHAPPSPPTYTTSPPTTDPLRTPSPPNTISTPNLPSTTPTTATTPATTTAPAPSFRDARRKKYSHHPASIKSSINCSISISNQASVIVRAQRRPR